MKKIKIGQIGIGHNHGKGKMLAVQKFPELFEVVGYAEEDETWVEKRGNLDAYKHLKRMSVEEIIEQSDAVLIECDVWNLTNYAKRCIDAGKHVHIDKPASGSLSEFKELLDAAERKKLTVQMGYMYRYNPSVIKCLEMAKRGELGEIYQIDAEMSTYHSKEYRAWLKNFKGGSMYIFGCHLLDLILLMMGEPKSMTSFIKQTGFEGVFSDDNCFAVLEYDKAIARVTNLSVEVNGWGMRRFAVMGSKGTVEIKPIERNVCMTHAGEKTAEDAYADRKDMIEVRDVPEAERYDKMMQEFYDCITGKIENPYTYAHEYLLQKILYQVIGGENK